jgi:hypothetical protein
MLVKFKNCHSLAIMCRVLCRDFYPCDESFRLDAQASQSRNADARRVQRVKKNYYQEQMVLLRYFSMFHRGRIDALVVVTYPRPTLIGRLYD